MARLLSQFGGIASEANYLTNAFDALAVGWRATASTSATTIDINRIAVNVARAPVNIVTQVIGTGLQLSWPATTSAGLCNSDKRFESWAGYQLGQRP